MDNKAFVFTGIVFLLVIPAVILAASLVNMMKTGDATTSLTMHSDATYFVYKNVELSFSRTGCNLVNAYGNNVTAIRNEFNNRWIPHIKNEFASKTGVNISVPTNGINASYNSAIQKVKIGSLNTSQGISLNVTSAATAYRGILGPAEFYLNCTYVIATPPPVLPDTTPPVVSISSPSTRAYCPATGDTVTLSLTFSVNEATSWIKYNWNGTNVTIAGNTQFDVYNNGTYNLTVYAMDTSGNLGSSTVTFLKSGYVYVTGFANATGYVVNFNNAKSATDSEAYAEIVENITTATSTHPNNQGFGSPGACSTSGWTNDESGDIDQDCDKNTGNPAPSIYSKVSKGNKNGKGNWTGSFTYTAGTPSGAVFAFDKKVTDYNRPGTTNRFTIILIKPDNNTYTITGPTNINAEDSGWISSGSIDVPVNELSQNGTYYIRIYTELSTTSGGGAKVQIHYDNVKLTISTPQGYKYDVNFTTTGVPFSFAGHVLEIKYKMPVADEDAYIHVWDTDISAWSSKGVLTAITNFAEFSSLLSLGEYNGGTIIARYTDAITGDTNQSNVHIDYHRVC